MGSKCKILITSTSFFKAGPVPLQQLKEFNCEIIENPYGRPLKEDELIPLLVDVDGVIAGLDEFGEKVLKSSNRLKVISRYGVGIDNIDMEAAKRLGIFVINTPDVNTQAVADLTFGLILSVSRKIPQSHQSTRKGRWERFIGREVYGKRLGIIGLGRIGKAVANRAKGFEMEIIAYDVQRDESFAETLEIKFLPLDDLLMEADFVTLHCGLNPQTKGLIGPRELGLMKETAYLINTARGELVNERALYEALKEGKIAGAGLDVYEQEPPLESPLLSLENAVTTGHIAAYTDEAIKEMALASVKNLLSALEALKSV
jgi:D-3-phosphoglycerate dehydrogenase